MKKRFKSPFRFPGTFMRRKYILLIAVVFSIFGTACSGQKEKTDSGAEKGGAIRKEAAITDQGEHIEMDKKTGPSQIPEELAQIPKDYFTSAGEQGVLEQLDYKTYESMSYQNKEKQLNKTAYVYLPYGYSENRKYNVFYLMHGGWSDETTYLGTPKNPNVLVNVIDHAIQDGKMEPVVIVCPTYNNENPDDSADYSLALQLTDNYHNELVNDLIPAVEGTYSTYAGGTSAEELEASRDHRAFAGFSMGSIATWHTFQYCLDYFRYFLPSSGNLTSDGAYMESLVTDSGHKPEDFFIYAMSGTKDFAYAGFSSQIEAMLHAPDGIFIAADNEQEGNLAYRVQEGNAHDGNAAMQYIYNGLIWIWK
ncbi:endo-1,4-beta-xylanase Y [Lachnospiraceae bacterium]|nr:endo-1,4-beta-xylanase Y [Lachnospiraceae bacterium]